MSELFLNATNSSEVGDMIQMDSVEWHAKLVAHIIILITSLVGNMLVLSVIRGSQQRRRRKTPYELFIANLAIADLTYIIVYFLAMYTDGTKHAFFCIFMSPLVTVTSTVSMLTLTAMAAFRCKAIVNPFKAKFSNKTVYLTIVSLWVIAFVCVIPLYIVLKVVDGQCLELWPSQSLNKAYTLALFVIEYVILMFVIIFSYTRIVFYLRRNKIPRTCLNESGRVSQKRRKDDQEVSKSLVVIVILYTILTLPHHLGWIFSEIFGLKDVAKVIFQFSGTLLLAHSCCNPFVYGSFARRFRRGYLRCLTRILCCGKRSKEGKRRCRYLTTSSESSDRQTNMSGHNMSAKELLSRNTTLRTTMMESDTDSDRKHHYEKH